ncbi:hypothetical protein WV31_10935 [Magnetospirillum sp. ME-1]|uniref:hypothetical protein n=1 Tax=Magnetospirillum sp. ME-1 TaxID=1639348 RepID=UPI000A17C69B|nr:hypothetical protein [Magnetospirillum sp. ME-1]ARJ66142.1 hypothetical protein WV31_10935 [Magnetospirillum sp. ME-1]
MPSIRTTATASLLFTMLAFAPIANAHEEDASPFSLKDPPALSSEQNARLSTALGLLASIDPSIERKAPKVRFAFFPHDGVLAGYFEPNRGIVGLDEGRSDCAMAAMLAHELTHAGRLGVGPGSRMVHRTQAFAGDYADFMVDEEAIAFLAQIRVAKGLHCLDEFEPAVTALEARTWGKPEAEARAIFRTTYDFAPGYWASYFMAFMADGPGVAPSSGQ